MELRILPIAAALAACGGPRPSGSVKAVVTATMPAAARVAVIEVGTTAFAFDPDIASIVRGGRVVATVRAPAGPWRAATSITGPDRRERWVIGLSGGELWRIATTGELTKVTDRVGVTGTPVLSLAGSGSMYVLGLKDGFLVHADDAHVMRFSGGEAIAVAAAKDRAAIATRAGVDVVDLVHAAQLHYPLTGVTSLAYLDATTDRATLVAVADGDVYRTDGRALHKLSAPRTRAIAAAGGRLWLLAGDKVYVTAPAQPVTEAVQPARAAALSGSRTGAVWVADDAARATEVTVEVPTEQRRWRELVAPVFERSCTPCHVAGGDADLDLSTPEAWTFNRAALVERVVVEHSMPPAGYDLSEADRQALARWLE